MPRVALNVQAPDFSLPDFRGDLITLSSFRGQKNLFLVFNRGFV